MAEYKDPIIAKLIEKLEAEGPEILRGKYYNGDVMLAPKSELPICSIAKDNATTGQASNIEDDHQMTLVINVLYDYTRDLSQSYDIVAGVNSLYEIVGAMNANYTLKTGTILHVLRKYQQLDNKLWLAVGPGLVITEDYGLGIERRGPGIFSVEAVLRVPVRVHRARPGL